MDHNSHIVRCAAVVSLVVLAGAAAAGAQSGSGLMLTPWEEGRTAQVASDFLYQGQADTEDRLDRDVDLQWYVAEGRYRLAADERFGPAVGFEFEHIEFTSSHPLVPDRLVDLSAAVGTGVAQFDWGGLLVTGGVGFAGDQPFSDGDAVYGRANVLAVMPKNEKMGWQFGLNYDGNRSIVPDVPLPTLNFYHRVSDELFYAVGLMYNVLYWTPNENFKVVLSHESPLTVDAVAAYQLFEGFWVEGGFHNRYKPYHIDGDDEHRRVFFTHRRLEAGIRWASCEWCELNVAGGWAFGQELERGYDSRHLDTLVEIDDAPYVRGGLSIEF